MFLSPSILAHTINCEDKKTSYFCKSSRCLDGPSFLCDQKKDCKGGEDETENYCSKLLKVKFEVF